MGRKACNNAEQAMFAKKAVSFSIDSSGLVGEKAQTLPKRNTWPKEGFVNRAKSWWQQQNLQGGGER